MSTYRRDRPAPGPDPHPGPSLAASAAYLAQVTAQLQAIGIDPGPLAGQAQAGWAASGRDATTPDDGERWHELYGWRWAVLVVQRQLELLRSTAATATPATRPDTLAEHIRLVDAVVQREQQATVSATRRDRQRTALIQGALQPVASPAPRARPIAAALIQRVQAVEDLACCARTFQAAQREVEHRLHDYGLAPRAASPAPATTGELPNNYQALAEQCRALARVHAANAEQAARRAADSADQMRACQERLAGLARTRLAAPAVEATAQAVTLPPAITQVLAEQQTWLAGAIPAHRSDGLVHYLMRTQRRTKSVSQVAVARQHVGFIARHAGHGRSVAAIERRVQQAASASDRAAVAASAVRQSLIRGGQSAWRAQVPLSRADCQRWIQPKVHLMDKRLVQHAQAVEAGTATSTTYQGMQRVLQRVRHWRDPRLRSMVSDLQVACRQPDLVQRPADPPPRQYDPSSGERTALGGNTEATLLWASPLVDVTSTATIAAAFRDVRPSGGIATGQRARKGQIKKTAEHFILSQSTAISAAEIAPAAWIWQQRLVCALLHIDPERHPTILIEHRPTKAEPNPHCHLYISRVRDDGAVWSLDAADKVRVCHLISQLQTVLFQQFHALARPRATFDPPATNHAVSNAADYRVYVTNNPRGHLARMVDGDMIVEDDFTDFFSSAHICQAVLLAGLPPPGGLLPGGLIKAPPGERKNIDEQPVNQLWATMGEYLLRARLANAGA